MDDRQLMDTLTQHGNEIAAYNEKAQYLVNSLLPNVESLLYEARGRIAQLTRENEALKAQLAATERE